MLKNMKIGAKLFLLLGFLSLLLIAIGVLGLRGIKATDDSLESIYNDRLRAGSPLGEERQPRGGGGNSLALRAREGVFGSFPRSRGKVGMGA